MGRATAHVAGQELVYETGKLAKLANGACVARCGGTVVLSTAVIDPTPRPDVDATPLQVRGRPHGDRDSHAQLPSPAQRALPLPSSAACSSCH